MHIDSKIAEAAEPVITWLSTVRIGVIGLGYPGCTEEDCVPVLEALSGLKLNADFHVGYSPERVNPGDREHRLADVVKVTSGSSPEALARVDQHDAAGPELIPIVQEQAEEQDPAGADEQPRQHDRRQQCEPRKRQSVGLKEQEGDAQCAGHQQRALAQHGRAQPRSKGIAANTAAAQGQKAVCYAEQDRDRVGIELQPVCPAPVRGDGEAGLD